MRLFLRTCLFSLILAGAAYSQTGRINYNDQELFLSGSNLAWVSFAGDIGPGTTDYDSFADIMLQMHDNGGNSLRWWLHTDGSQSPEFDDAGYVIGPADGTIEDLKEVLDLAWEREIGVILCLWSFDMLRESNDSDVLARNLQLLTDTTYTRAYINNALIPMVDSLKGHPAIIAWEIFNEPEGMSNEFGWSSIDHVSMTAIQRFINLTTGAIHRTDTSAIVTSGSWCFKAMSDVDVASKVSASERYSQLTASEKESIAEFCRTKYNLDETTDEIIEDIVHSVSATSYNYYSDDRLIAAGGDADGALDFYSVHYYELLGDAYSPFLYSSSSWGLDKEIVVAEFWMTANDGISKESLFKRLYNTGYAGALPWSWSDNAVTSQEDILAGMLYMYENYKDDVDVDGISGDWPTVSITSPVDGAEYPDSSDITLTAEAADTDGEVVSVEFIVNDTLTVAIDSTAPYSVTWLSVPQDKYTIQAIATDDSGNQRYSDAVEITVGEAQYTYFEAESANLSGTDISIVSDATASNDSYVQAASSDGTITWTLPNVYNAGTYVVVFGARLTYGSPKTQYIIVNEQDSLELEFDGSTSKWSETATTVDLLAGENKIQMGLYWGWMDIDYLAVPSDIVTDVDDAEIEAKPVAYSLSQNYPNPFNPSTTIEYVIPESGKVTIRVYDILGREVAELINKAQAAGSYSIQFNASHLASGMYIYRIQAGEYVESKQMMLLK